jgi:AcrR family transcriptional regulator
MEKTREGTPSGARERILEAAYQLFSRRGVRAVGIDQIIATSSVSRMTLYRHFRSKDDLVMAFLERRERLWTREWLEEKVKQATDDPRGRLLAIFDVFDGWFQAEDFEGCSFINVLLETAEPSARVQQESVRQLARIRSLVSELAAEAGFAEPEEFARKWHILMKGAIVSRAEGDVGAARRAREIGALLLENSR